MIRHAPSDPGPSEIPEFATYPSRSGRVVLVTGGSSGIGADIVRTDTADDSRMITKQSIHVDAGLR